MADYAKVATNGELAPGQGKVVEVQGKEIALFNVGGAYFAIDNMCTHEEASLADGEISGFEVTCPLHGAKFDVRSGRVVGPPAYDDVTSYSVRVSGADVEIDVG